MIVDTDVLVWDLRGNVHARTTLRNLAPFTLSVVTYIELVQGMRNRRELSLLLRQLRTWNAEIRQIDSNVSARAMFFVETYFLSHSTYLADALIAATAIEAGEELLTANRKHYQHFHAIRLQEFRPEG